VGTTVAVSEVFSALPVRHREFKKRLKAEFARLVAVLQVRGWGDGPRA
jgi:DNA mismatch repair ATPase MutL